MSLDYLEDLEKEVDNGKDYYVCQGLQSSEWALTPSLDQIKKTAQRTANGRKLSVNVYRLINRMDTVAEDSYLVVRRILDPGPRGEPKFQWVIVDTREAAEMLRDVSQGPTPYFGAVVEASIEPNQDALGDSAVDKPARTPRKF